MQEHLDARKVVECLLQERRELVRRAEARLIQERSEHERLIREYMPVMEALREKYRQRVG